MSRILILGNGLSVGPLASYFHDRGHRLTIGCRRPEAGRALARGALDATIVQLDLDAPAAPLAPLAAEHDLVASFVPGPYQPRVAEACLAARRPLVMSCHHHYLDAFPGGCEALDARARESGVAIVTELGVDCGYLGMLAKREIDRLQAEGRRIRSIDFHTGVIPGGPINPFDYAFFWAAKKAAISYVSPATGKADWIREGARVSVDKHGIYASPELVDIPGASALETHPNLDSGAFQYDTVYGVEGIERFYHGTLRHLGWCSAMAALVGLGFDGREPRPDLVGRPFREVVSTLCGGGDARAAAAAKLSLRRHDDAILRLEWLGLFGDRPARAGGDGSLSDLVTELLLDRLGVFGYDSGVASRVVNRFDIVAGRSAADEKPELVRSVFDVTDDGRGHSICSRLISQTTAIVGRHLLDGELAGWTGLHHPYDKAIYEPILREFAAEGIGNRVSSSE